MEAFQIHNAQNAARVTVLLKAGLYLGLVRTLPEDFDRQLRENQSKQDFSALNQLS